MTHVIDEYTKSILESSRKSIELNYQEEGVIQKVNPVTVHVVDFKGNLWKVEKEDILRNIPNSKFLD